VTCAIVDALRLVIAPGKGGLLAAVIFGATALAMNRYPRVAAWVMVGMFGFGTLFFARSVLDPSDSMWGDPYLAGAMVVGRAFGS
jgi:hypothetical protein